MVTISTFSILHLIKSKWRSRITDSHLLPKVYPIRSKCCWEILNLNRFWSKLTKCGIHFANSLLKLNFSLSKRSISIQLRYHDLSNFKHCQSSLSITKSRMESIIFCATCSFKVSRTRIIFKAFMTILKLQNFLNNLNYNFNLYYYYYWGLLFTTILIFMSLMFF